MYKYICSGIPRPEKWGDYVQNINLIRRNGFVEAAYVCFNLWFCLLLSIHLYFSNTVKPDRKNWRQLLVDQQSGNWGSFPTIFCEDPTRFLKVGRVCNILPHARSLVEERCRYIVYIAFYLNIKTWF